MSYICGFGNSIYRHGSVFECAGKKSQLSGLVCILLACNLCESTDMDCQHDREQKTATDTIMGRQWTPSNFMSRSAIHANHHLAYHFPDIRLVIILQCFPVVAASLLARGPQAPNLYASTRRTLNARTDFRRVGLRWKRSHRQILFVGAPCRWIYEILEQKVQKNIHEVGPEGGLGTSPRPILVRLH
jgi:hypothetical protein